MLLCPCISFLLLLLLLICFGHDTRVGHYGTLTIEGLVAGVQKTEFLFVILASGSHGRISDEHFCIIVLFDDSICVQRHRNSSAYNSKWSLDPEFIGGTWFSEPDIYA